MQQYLGGGSVTVYAKENADTKKRNADIRARKALKGKEDTASRNEKGEKAYEKELVHRKTFTWEAINYVVPVPGGTRRLLHDVYGYVKPGILVSGCHLDCFSFWYSRFGRRRH